MPQVAAGNASTPQPLMTRSNGLEARIRSTQSCSLMPEFTLYSDGLDVFVHRIERVGKSVLCVSLSSARVDSIVRHVRGLGVERLESHESQEAKTSDSTSVMVVDASYSIIRMRLSSGELRTIRNYAEFANYPEILAQVRRYFLDWYDPSATTYVPRRATLAILEIESESSGGFASVARRPDG